MLTTHEIRLTMPSTTQVINADVVFHRDADGVRLGELQVSKRSLDWRPASNPYLKSLTWDQFDRLMDDNGGPGRGYR